MKTIFSILFALGISSASAQTGYQSNNLIANEQVISPTSIFAIKTVLINQDELVLMKNPEENPICFNTGKKYTIYTVLIARYFPVIHPVVLQTLIAMPDSMTKSDFFNFQAAMYNRNRFNNQFKKLHNHYQYKIKHSRKNHINTLKVLNESTPYKYYVLNTRYSKQCIIKGNVFGHSETCSNTMIRTINNNFNQ